MGHCISRRFLSATACVLFVLPASADQILFFNFNDASNAAVAVDSSGNGNDGDISVATYTADAGGRTGQAGDHALDFGAFNNGAVLSVPNAAGGPLIRSRATTPQRSRFGSSVVKSSP